MGKLSDILTAGGFGGDSFFDGNTQPADDYEPLPPDTYVCHAHEGELRNARTGTPGYLLKFRIIEGENVGRFIWHDLWLTPAAKPYSMRDLLKLGIDSDPKMELPLPVGIRCKVKVALRRDDDGTERNRVVRFEVVGIDKPEVDPFAPESEGGAHDGE